MSDRGLSLASDSCCSKVMISVRIASHLLTKIVGEDHGGFEWRVVVVEVGLM